MPAALSPGGPQLGAINTANVQLASSHNAKRFCQHTASGQSVIEVVLTRFAIPTEVRVIPLSYVLQRRLPFVCGSAPRFFPDPVDGTKLIWQIDNTCRHLSPMSRPSS